jgi:hypothetical protein
MAEGRAGYTSQFIIKKVEMPEFTAPSRHGLVLGAALVALHGLRKEYVLGAIHWGYSNENRYQPYALVSEAISALTSGAAFKTDDERILDLMAHTRQLMRISYEEWEACVPLTARTPDPHAAKA